MFLLLLLLPFVTFSSLYSEELNVTEGITELQTDVTELFSSERTLGHDEAENVTATLQEPVAQSARSVTPKPGTRGPRLARRKPRRSRRFRPGNGPRYREQPGYNPVNVYNPYYRAPQTYYDVYYNPYQGYYPEYAQPGYYPAYPYQPQQPYPQPYPHPPPPPVIPTPPPTLAPIPDLYYVQNTDGHYQYRRVSVTRRTSDPRGPQYPGNQQYGHYNAYERRTNQGPRYPRRPARHSSSPSEFRPQLRLTSAPYQAQVFGVTSPPPPEQATETSGS